MFQRAEETPHERIVPAVAGATILAANITVSCPPDLLFEISEAGREWFAHDLTTGRQPAPTKPLPSSLLPFFCKRQVAVAVPGSYGRPSNASTGAYAVVVESATGSQLISIQA